MVPESAELVPASKRSTTGASLVRSCRTPSGPTLLVGSACAAQILNLVTLLSTAGFYSPGEVGVAQSFSAVLAALAVVACGRIEQIILVRGDAETNPLVATGCAIALVSAIITTFVLLAVRWRSTGGLHPCFWVLPPAIIVVALSQLLQAVALKRERLGALGRARVDQAGATAIATPVLGWAGAGVYGLVVAQILNFSAGVRRLRSNVAPEVTLAGLWSKRKMVFSVMWSVRSLLVAGVVSGFVNQLAWTTPVILMFATSGAAEAGLFGLTIRCFGPIRMIITTTLDNIATSRGSACIARGDLVALRHELLSLSRKSVAAATVVAFLAVAAAYCMRYLPLRSWAGLSVYALPFGLVVAVQIAVMPLTALVVVLQKQRQHVWLDLLRALLVIAAFIVPHKFGVVGVDLVKWYALAMLAMYVIYACYYFVILPKANGGMMTRRLG